MRRKTLAKLPLTGEPNTLEIEVYFNAGGTHTRSLHKEPKGIYISACPMHVDNGWKRYRGFTGQNICVKALSRFSQRALDEVHADASILEHLIKRVMHTNQLNFNAEGQQQCDALVQSLGKDNAA